MTTYAELDALLMRNGKPVPSRKVANNTYAQRLPSMVGNRIGIKFHDTFVVIYDENEGIRLDTGGWITQATCARINRFTPSTITLYSIKGRWYVRHMPGFTTQGALEAPTSPFCDGMHLIPLLITEHGIHSWQVTNGLNPDERKRQDAHNRRIEKLIDSYMRWLTLERYEITFQTHRTSKAMCGMCVRTNVGMLVGDSFEDKQHLIEHLIDKNMPFDVFHTACDHGYGGGDGINRARHYDLAKRDLRKYLRQQLYVGPVAIKGGKRPAHTEPWSMTARLRGKSA